MPNVSRPELIWSGKYDDQGNLRPVERTILPFQVVETVNESKADREASQRDFFTKRAQDKTWRNRLIWGDNKIVMASLLPELAGKIKLIYIDPPFATGQDFSFRLQVGDEEIVKEPSVIEDKAYRDTWGDGLHSYLRMLRDRFLLLQELLSDDGMIYVHIGWGVSHYVKLPLDEVFGEERFVNQIIWKRQTAHSDIGQGSQHFGPIHDVILLYSKSERFTWNMQYTKYAEDFASSFYRHVEPETQRRYGLSDITGPGGASKGNPYYEFLGVTRYWRFSRETMEKLYAQGRIVQTNPGTVPRQKRYLDEMPGIPLQDLWLDIPTVQAQSAERLGYDTQKPEALLERIIRVSSNEGDLVADFFCGSGTTLAVAEKLGRRWLGADLSKWSVQVTRKRLLQIPNCRSFELQNLGHYERHKLAANGHGAWERYVTFILELYRAEPITGFKHLHGKKARAYVHVGSVDSPITMREIHAALEEAKRNGVKEVHFLGWDFEMGIHDLSAEIQDEYGVKPRLVSIPKEALEVSNPAKEEVRFFDLNYLEVEHELKGKKLTVALKDFIIANPEYLPDEVREKIKKFTDYVDYWAVDWDYKDDTFHNQWQSFRTRKEPKLETKAGYPYEQAGKYKVMVKVVDIFGNDTTKLLEVTVK